MIAALDRPETEAALGALRATLPSARIAAAPAEIAALLRDQSWLSPSLRAERRIRTEQEGGALGVVAAVAPQGEDELAAAIAIAVRHRLPLTLRGAATTNFGLIDPQHGGLILDLRGLSGTPSIGDGSVSVAGGSVFGDLERSLRAAGAEVPVLTTTYPVATVAGWIAGGHVGLGSSTYGALWDGLVRRVRLMTIEQTPRILTLDGAAVEPVLHSFGVTGVIVEAELATAPAQDWVEVVGNFPDFDHASAFTTDISCDPRFLHRVVAAQEPAAVRGLRALAPAVAEGAPVLAILERSQIGEANRLAARHHGRLVEWQDWAPDGGERPSIATMVYGHRMLWVKRLMPDAAFLHIYPDPAAPDAALRSLKARFGDALLIESKFVRSPWMLRALGHGGAPSLPAAVIAIGGGAPGADLAGLIAVCDAEGIRYQNPHVAAVEDNGLFADVAPIAALKSRTDPYELLHRGRLRAATRAA